MKHCTGAAAGRVAAVALVTALLSSFVTADEWEVVLKETLRSDFSQDRHDGLQQIDTTSDKGLKVLWGILANRDPDRIDWYVREGAYESLLEAEGEEAEKEILKVLKSRDKRYELAQEAIVYSVIWKIRKEFVKAFGGNDDEKIAEAKYLLRKTRGLEYFELILPVIRKIDPERKKLEWIQKAFESKSSRVRRAAIHGFLAYPHASSIPLLIDNLKALAKSKSTKRRAYREWVSTRYALEILTGQYYREDVENWERWWSVAKDTFSIEKRVEEEKGGEDEGQTGRTTVVRRGGVEVRVKMKVAGDPDNYPLLVLPWRGYEPDYFRPYFHGVEEFLRVFYLQMPQIGDFKGLPRDANSNFVRYPTELLAEALAQLMQDTGLEQFAVLAHGPEAGLLGMHMTAKFSGAVSHLVLINPRSAGSDFRDAIDSIERLGKQRKNNEMVNGAKNRLIGKDGKPIYEPGDAAEAEGLGRALGNLMFADPTEPEVGAFGFFYQLGGGTSVLIDSEWTVQKIFGGSKPPQPVLIIHGELDPWAPEGKVARVAGALKSTVVKFPRSAQMPFMSETDRFTVTMEAFFRPVVARRAKEKEKEKESDE